MIPTDPVSLVGLAILIGHGLFWLFCIGIVFWVLSHVGGFILKMLWNGFLFIALLIGVIWILV
jgi:hypothetical protein